MPTQPIGFLYVFLTALVAGCGWTIGCFLMSRFIAIIGGIGARKAE